MSHMYQVVEIGVAWGNMKAYYPSTFPLLAFSTKDGLRSDALLGQLPSKAALLAPRNLVLALLL